MLAAIDVKVNIILLCDPASLILDDTLERFVGVNLIFFEIDLLILSAHSAIDFYLHGKF